MIGTEEELISLHARYTSRKESGTVGDIIGINPRTNIMSLDEAILTSKNIQLVKQR